MSRAALMTVAAAAVATVLPLAAAGAGCPLDSFGARKLGTCPDASCRSSGAPPEIAAIKRGFYNEMVGLFINDGLAEWTGVDLDAGDIVNVRRYAGPRVDGAPSVEQSSARLNRRETRPDGKPIIDIIRREPLAREAMEEIVCAANDAWADAGRPPMSSISDMHLGIVLVDGGTRRTDGGPFGMRDAARALQARLDALRTSTWPDR